MALAESPANKRIKGLQVAHADRQGSAHAVILEPSPRRVRVMFNGETIADSSSMQLLHEDGHLPIYYFPVADVRMDLLEKTEHSTHCPHKGDASYWTVRVGDREAENAVWGYEDPLPIQPGLKGLVAFYWGRMDQWFEEDEEIFVHPRDPYKRIDTIASSRRVTVTLGGTIVADTTNAVFLFETGLPTRYYIPKKVRYPNGLPLQRGRELFQCRGRREDLRGHRVVLPGPDPGDSENQRSPVLL